MQLNQIHKKVSKTLCFAFFVSLQLIGSAEASQATTGCAAIKKQVLKLENAVRAEQAFWVRHEGEKIKGSLELAFQKSERNQYLKELGKLQYNNQGCFTKSQYDQVLSRHHWTAPYTMSFGATNTARDSDCKGNPTSTKDIDLGKWAPKGTKRGIICDIPQYLYVDMKNNLYGQSIYSY